MNEVDSKKRSDTCRMFDNDVLEKFSRIHPLTPFVVYVPVVGTLLYRAWHGGVGLPLVVGLVIGGLVFWTLTEYLLHRYVFHWRRDTRFGHRVHFLLHGVHHDYPNDADRLVMPVGFSAPLAVLFYLAFYLVFGGARLGEPFFAGMTLGYLWYDSTHYAVHHFRQTSRIGKLVKRHHMLHHHADHDGGFGVSSPLWDLILGTMPRVKKLGRTHATK